MAGFYLRFLTLDPIRLGLAPSSSMLTVAATSLTRWIIFVAPWMSAAFVGSATYGALGR